MAFAAPSSQVNNLSTIGDSAVKTTECAVRCRLLNILLGGGIYPNLQLLQSPNDLYWDKSVSMSLH